MTGARRIVTFTNLFPSAAVPSHGVFVRERMRRVTEALGCEWEVVCPLPRVPRWLPRPSVWKDEDVVSMRPARVVRTFVEASLFLVAFPVFAAVQALQNAGILPVLLELR